MAAISVSISHGVDGFKICDFTFGTNAPGGGDIELRFNTTDAIGNNLTRLDVRKALDAFQRAYASGALFTTTPVL
jgi:hypothetical protein